jgi:septal ring factor EnvC (AmiA/AmiB activator)
VIKKFPANVWIFIFCFFARQLEEKENEANEMYKKMTALHSQRNAQTSRMEEMEAEMAQVQLELSELQTQCEDKDAQVCSNVYGHFFSL